MQKYFLVGAALFFCLGLRAQKKNEAFQLAIKSATSPIKIDGIMDEAAWLDANVASDFFYGSADGYKHGESQDRSSNDLR